MNKKCKCGNLFEAIGNRKYCSNECKKNFTPKRIRNRNRTIQCGCCGKDTIKTRSEGFCSRECSEKHNGRRVEVSCDHCGEKVDVKRSKFESYTNHFCSKECHNKSLENKITKQCNICGDNFTVVANVAKKQASCSAKCSNTNPSVNFPKELIEKLYVDEDMTAAEIGFILGTSKTQILRHIKKYNIKVRSSSFGNRKLLICKDGHLVKSHYERAIDNAMTRLGIKHEYEPRLPWNKRYAADFKVDDVYVEVWGMCGWKKYEETKKRKEKIYKENNAKVLSIYPEDFKDINKIMYRLKELIS